MGATSISFTLPLDTRTPAQITADERLWKEEDRRTRIAARRRLRRAAGSLKQLEGRTVLAVRVELRGTYDRDRHPDAVAILTLDSGAEVEIETVSFYYEGEEAAPRLTRRRGLG